jgi:hypothetical protein
MTIQEGDIRGFILDMWRRRMSPRQISEAVGLPVDEVYRLLRRLEKELVKERGVENHGEKIHI